MDCGDQGGAATYLESAQQHLELKQMKEELTTRLTLVIEQVPITIIVIILLTANFHNQDDIFILVIQ